MEENEVMAMEEVIDETNDAEIDENEAGMSTGLAMLIGSGVTLAAIAAGKAVKKAWNKFKTKKADNGDESDAVIETEIADADSKKKSKNK